MKIKSITNLLLLCALVLAINGTAMAASKSDTPPNIEKVTFVHYAKSDDHSKPIWDDTVSNFKLIAGGVKWFSTITYEINPAGSGLSPELVRSTLEASSEIWDLQTSFELFTSPTLTGNTLIGYDHINRVVWGTLNPGVIAVTYLWYNPASKQMVEFDMVFNNYYLWRTDGADNAMDLQNIATHEFGHNGLSDLKSSKDQALTMYAYSDLGETIKRTLGTGDMLGIQKLYGYGI